MTQYQRLNDLHTEADKAHDELRRWTNEAIVSHGDVTETRRAELRERIVAAGEKMQAAYARLWDALLLFKPTAREMRTQAIQTILMDPTIVEAINLRTASEIERDRLQRKGVAWCTFCKKDHPGGATCMGRHP